MIRGGGEKGGGTGGRAILLAAIVAVSVVVGPVGAATVGGGTADQTKLGSSPDIVAPNATIDASSSSTITVAYNATGQTPGDLAVSVNNGTGPVLASNSSLVKKNDTVDLTIQPGDITGEFTATVRLIDTTKSPGNQLLKKNTSTVRVASDHVGVKGQTVANDSTTTVPVRYNASGSVGATSDLAVRLNNTSDGSNVARDTSLSAFNGTAKMTVDAGTVENNFTAKAVLVDTSTAPNTTLDTDSAAMTVADTTPSVSGVTLANASGDMDVQFTTDQQLGTDKQDITVEVTGPNGATYWFHEGDFSKTGSGPYTYSLSTTQAYGDGEGVYTAAVRSAVDVSGNDGGTNGTGSGLTDGYDYDTTAPTVLSSTPALSESSGNMDIQFTTDESLGTSAADVTVRVDGPNGATYWFDRTDFSELGSGPYTYSLSVTQAYDDGEGTYNMEVLTAADAASNDGGTNGTGSGLTAAHRYTPSYTPAVSNVGLSESNDDMVITFNANESLGGQASDVTVRVDGPNGVTYWFDRAQFSELGSGPQHQYSLTATQSFDDGYGTYNLKVTTAADPAGNDGGTNGTGSGLTDTYDYAASGYVNGTVTNSSGPIKNAWVGAVDSNNNVVDSDTTNAKGNYSLSIDSNTKRKVIADGDPQNNFSLKPGISVAQGATNVVNFTLKGYPKKGTISGTVLDADGNPVQGVSVEARELSFRFGGTATTDKNGKFSITVPASTYRLRTNPGPKSDIAPKTVESVNVTAGQTTSVTLQSSNTGYIVGTVENATGSPQTKGVFVVANSDSGQAQFSGTNKTGGYNITAPTGDYTVSVFSENESADPTTVTVTDDTRSVADFTLKNATVNRSSVTVASGAGPVDTADIGVRSALRAGLLQVQLVNESTTTVPAGSTGAPQELESAGVSDSTTFEINLTVTNFSANSLLWGINDARWNTSTNNSVRNGTDINISGTPVQLQAAFDKSIGQPFGPVFSDNPKWVSGRNDRADVGRNETVYFGVADLSNVPASARSNLKGMSVTTNAQKFTVPKVVNNSLRIWVAAPTTTVDGSDHSGFYQAEIPDSTLTDWGVTNPTQELQALYKGDPANFTVTDTDGGARIRLDNISYSAGFVNVDADTVPTASTGGSKTLNVGESTTFDGSGSSDDGTITSYEWDFDGDGTTDATGVSPTHSFGSPGTYTVTLTVTDDGGNTDTSTVSVTVQDNTAPIASVSSATSAEVGDTVSFDGSGSSDNVGITSYDWTLPDGTATGSSTAAHTFESAGTYTIDLTVTDGAGNSDTASVTVTVESSGGGGGGGATTTTTTTTATTGATTTTEDETAGTTEATTTTEAETTADTGETTDTTADPTDDAGDENDASDTTAATTATGATATTAAEDTTETTTTDAADATTTTTGGQPGFGVLVALLAALAAVLLAVRRD
jgi:PGF-CTERM protein